MMDIEKMTSLASRVFFGIAMLALLLGALEKIVNILGYTILSPYTPERMLEISVAFALFILVFLVRQIRQDLRSRNQRG
jgi:hypothetical protein